MAATLPQPQPDKSIDLHRAQMSRVPSAIIAWRPLGRAAAPGSVPRAIRS